LVWVIIGYVIPFFGLELVDMARGVADFNLPARVGELFGVSLQGGGAQRTTLGHPSGLQTRERPKRSKGVRGLQ
jgi:hypothetical protein